MFNKFLLSITIITISFPFSLYKPAFAQTTPASPLDPYTVEKIQRALELAEKIQALPIPDIQQGSRFYEPTEDDLQVVQDFINIAINSEFLKNIIISRAIKMADEDGDGMLQKGNVERFVPTVYGLVGIYEVPTIEEIDVVFAEMDRNNDEVVSRDEVAEYVGYMFNRQLENIKNNLNQGLKQPEL